ncbi:hypothetical protein [Ornithinibacillus bavariensis]|uniref:Uncharacterized protein n=1 Tax=Ornithinibacillus bavariensis TaxID=545502 RepID=A0A919XDM6_9BACI|nr:hypothetical protein [Ornithinibacillus bavariensis]GIO28578.1 hypothetical protein J43TS3_31890 [Ornithinibacillus bavariensis]
MLSTSLGPIKIYVNDIDIDFIAVRYILDEHCKDVNGRYFIQYEYKKEYKKQKIRCCLPSIKEEGDIEIGERQEAIFFYKDFTILTIGIEASLGTYEEYGYDYSGS